MVEVVVGEPLFLGAAGNAHVPAVPDLAVEREVRTVDAPLAKAERRGRNVVIILRAAHGGPQIVKLRIVGPPQFRVFPFHAKIQDLLFTGRQLEARRGERFFHFAAGPRHGLAQ